MVAPKIRRKLFPENLFSLFLILWTDKFKTPDRIAVIGTSVALSTTMRSLSTQRRSS